MPSLAIELPDQDNFAANPIFANAYSVAIPDTAPSNP